jgi:ariadne-1
VNEGWFSSHESVTKELGIVEEAEGGSGAVQDGRSLGGQQQQQQHHHHGNEEGEEQCLICFDSFRRSEMCAAACGHAFCESDYGGYVHEAISNGPASLDLRCPLPKCGAFVSRAGFILKQSCGKGRGARAGVV